MSYKVDREKSHTFNNILITTGLIIAIIGGGATMINIFSKNAGLEANQNIVSVATVKDKEATQTNEINITEEYTPKYDIATLRAEYPNAWGKHVW